MWTLGLLTISIQKHLQQMNEKQIKYFSPDFFCIFTKLMSCGSFSNRAKQKKRLTSVNSEAYYTNSVGQIFCCFLVIHKVNVTRSC